MRMALTRRGRDVKSVGPVQGSASGLRTCPFKFFHECKDGKPGSAGFFRLLEHMQSTHFKTENRKLILKEAISRDVDLFLDVGEVLKAGGKWLCGRCMVMHALSRGCKHDDEIVSFAIVSGDVDDFIVGIRKPCQVVVDTNPCHPATVGGGVMSHPQIPRVTGGPGVGYSDVVGIVIDNQHNIIMHSGSRIETFQL
ncbi:hypothetical protein HanRHA438_Chr15g0684671 [Helianthus annuus]|nr:hypothetical protein HanRHA438_Chr15g0684671 [Helianthus annuus]